MVVALTLSTVRVAASASSGWPAAGKLQAGEHLNSVLWAARRLLNSHQLSSQAFNRSTAQRQRAQARNPTRS